VIVDVLVGGVLALVTALALAWKWQLGLARSAAWMAVFALAAGAAVWALASSIGMSGIIAAGLVWLIAVGLGVAAVLYRFYRDPERIPPAEDGVVVSPADGEVLYVRQARKGTLPVSTKRGRDYELVELTKTPLSYDDAVVIGIGLSFLDVHVNRSPIAGTVALHRRYPGLFASLRQPEMVFENERATMIIEREGLQVGVVMIASRLVRRIVAYVKEGEVVGVGQRIGMIRFGSQVDVVLPRRHDVVVDVREGDRVKAGETIVARFQVREREVAAMAAGQQVGERPPD
jgi:phosphatidylserine decarboxylase